MKLRNEIVHTASTVTPAKAREVVTGVMKEIRELSSAP